MLIRLFLKMLLFVTLGRWIYAEATIIAPESIPTVDRILSATQIPTHDTWPEVDWKELSLQLHEAIAGER